MGVRGSPGWSAESVMAVWCNAAVVVSLVLLTWGLAGWAQGELPEFCTQPDLQLEDSGPCLPDLSYGLARLEGGTVGSRCTNLHLAVFNTSQVPACFRDSPQQHAFPWRGVQDQSSSSTNHTWTVEINSHTSLTLRTLHSDPQVIEVSGFLSAAESEHLVRLAKKQGLTVPKLNPMEKYANEPLPVYDLDDNGKLSLSEMVYTVGMTLGVIMDEKDVLQMYDALGATKEANGDVALASLGRVPRVLLDKYLTDLVRRQPERQFRHSQTARLSLTSSADRVLLDVLTRLSKLVGLPVELLRFSDFEVTKLGVKGHSYPQYDSQSAGGQTSWPCCPLSGHLDTCRACRFLTASLFLNDVDEGGETSFYFLEKDVNDEEVAVTPERLRTLGDCGKAGVRVKPRQGALLLWYNHFRQPQTGWLGALDSRLLHGHCPVGQGEKWVASLGVRITQNKADDLEAMTLTCG